MVKDCGGLVSSHLTLRDYFAAKAMEAIMGKWSYLDPNRSMEVHGPACGRLAAKWAYQYADEMLKERTK